MNLSGKILIAIAFVGLAYCPNFAHGDDWPEEFDAMWTTTGFTESATVKSQIDTLITAPNFRKALLDNFFDNSFTFPDTTALQRYARMNPETKKAFVERAIRAALIFSLSEEEVKAFLKKYFVDPAVAIRDGSDQSEDAKAKLYERMIRLGSLDKNGSIVNLKFNPLFEQRPAFAKFFGLGEKGCFF
ncbi:MAG: hypothetical protein H6617_04870 [Bdellovibrionaceae bacterium]|nr:hypothetical protein [Bdellovibrionales bacterium]MCB9253995.1 hypothetical protein [Pseudobdellovibrionaceae bacterium]